MESSFAAKMAGGNAGEGGSGWDLHSGQFVCAMGRAAGDGREMSWQSLSSLLSLLSSLLVH